MKNKTILVVSAHPDDMDFGSSGTVAAMVDKGYDAYLIIATDGSRGSDDLKMTHEHLAEIRRQEQEESGKILGLKKIFFLSHPDTQLVADLTLKEEIVRIIRTVRPSIVITMDPTYYYSVERGFINHTDHRAAGLAAMDACYPLCRDRLTFLEHEKQGLKPHKVEELWFVSFDAINYVVDISKALERKLKALACHKSQVGDFKEAEKWVRERAAIVGKSKGYKFAENFKRIKLP